MADRGMTRAAQTLEAAGFDVVRFNFPYREKGSRRPDPMPVLKAAHRRGRHPGAQELAPRKLIIGGRSMGGRAASMLAADGFECDGLLLLAYPLHPAGQPEKLRDAHLAADPRSGAVLQRDPRRAMPARADGQDARQACSWQMHWLEGADHSFHVLKSSGRTDERGDGGGRHDRTGWLRGLDA